MFGYTLLSMQGSSSSLKQWLLLSLMVFEKLVKGICILSWLCPCALDPEVWTLNPELCI